MKQRRNRSDLVRDGEQSQRVAKMLMDLTEAQLAPLKLEEDLKEEVRYSFRQTASGARRREQRRLGGVLRRYDLDEVEAIVDALGDAARADAARFRRAEAWRARLLDEGAGALDAFAQDAAPFDRQVLLKLVDDGQHEVEHGTPKGAQRKLFRLLRELLAEQPKNAEGSGEEGGDRGEDSQA